MARNVAIRAEGLSKRFRLGEALGYRTLRESVVQRLREALHRPPAKPDFVWALRDVDFTIGRGEVIGIIGSNGAGKSTLLKVLSRVTAPTVGRVQIDGRVGSLLEVGTGFHPELTGRENVYLNGAILGMRRAEIDTKFDAIVAFSGVERFLDTPVKRYSSGMHVRLAFAVAAHLEPEILIVDEVLAVGDAAFQKSCLQKMGDVAEGGRTVLFVSHNMKAVRRLCTRLLWLSEGRVVADGATEDVVAAYLRSTQKLESLEEMSSLLDELPPDPCFRLLDACVRQHGMPTTAIRSGEPLEIEVIYEVREPTRGLRVYFDLCDSDREPLIRSFHDDDAEAVGVVAPGRYRATATVPADLLAPHEYLLILRGTIDEVRNLTGPGVAIPLRVTDTSRINRAYPHQPARAKLRPFIPWKTEVIL